MLHILCRVVQLLLFLDLYFLLRLFSDIHDLTRSLLRYLNKKIAEKVALHYRSITLTLRYCSVPDIVTSTNTLVHCTSNTTTLASTLLQHS